MARKKKQGISVNLSDAESYFRPPEGRYELEIIAVEQGEGNSLAWDFKIKAGKFKGREFRDYTSLEPAALYRARSLVEATGANIEDADVDLEYFEGLIGETLSAKVGYREWEGKEKISVTYELPGTGDDDEDEAPPKRGKRYRDDDDDDDKPARGKKKPKDDDEEEEEKPRGRRNTKDDDDDKPARGKKKPKAADLTQEEIRDMDTDELEALVEKHDLDVDLSSIKTLKKQQNAVIDAANEAGLLSED